VLEPMSHSLSLIVPASGNVAHDLLQCPGNPREDSSPGLEEDAILDCEDGAQLGSRGEMIP